MNAASVEERAPSTAPSPSGVNTGDLVDEQAVRILGTLDGASAATLHGFRRGAQVRGRSCLTFRAADLLPRD